MQQFELAESVGSADVEERIKLVQMLEVDEAV